jgi:hypothetical protein
MAVDVEDGCAIFFGVDDVLVPNLVVKRASHGSSLYGALDFMRSAQAKPYRQGGKALKVIFVSFYKLINKIKVHNMHK